MKKVMEFLKKHKKAVIWICILLIVVGGFFYIKAKITKASEALLSSLNAGEAAKVEVRSLVNSLAATGKIDGIESSDVYANVSGVEVLSLEVSDGDEVKEGDIICILDGSEYQKKLEEMQTSLDVTVKKSDSSVAIANRGLSESQTGEAVQVSRDFEDADDYYEDYLKALEKLDEAQREYDTAVDFFNFRQKEYEDYKAEYPDLDEYSFLNRTERGSYYKSNMTSAESDMKSKKSTLDSRKDAVDSALDKYNSLLRNYEDHVRNDDSSIMSKNDSLQSAILDRTTATISTDQQIRSLKKQVEECTVRAPRDGIVTNLSIKVGDYYNATSIASIKDASSYEVVAEISEYDIAKVSIGQRVVIKTNGTGDLELEGRVESIAPTATKAANNTVATNVTYKVKIAILTDCKDIKLDMTAKLSIILDNADNVLTVPYDAVMTDDEGRFYVQTVETDENGSIVSQNDDVENRIYITKGIESDYYIEISGDGIKEGLEVLLPKTDTTNAFMELMAEQGSMGGF